MNTDTCIVYGSMLTKTDKRGEHELHVEDLPKSLCESRSYLKAGIHLPYPSGPHWPRLVGNNAYRKLHQDRLNIDDVEEEQSYAAMREYNRALVSDSGVSGLAFLCRALVAYQLTHDECDNLINSIVSADPEEVGLATALKARRIKGRQKISVTDDPEPRKMVEALMGDRVEEWVTYIYKEYNGLMDQGVFSRGHTIADLRARAIVGKPVPCSIALTHKYKDGILEKLKTRICIAGHKGNVTKGIHYSDVFSPNPNQHTERVLQAMRVDLHLHNLTWDVRMAYTWAPLPPSEQIAVICPDGFKEHHAPRHR